MITIIIAAQKGGAGKTTLAAHLGVVASTQINVAMADLDPQGSLAAWAGIRGERAPQVATVYHTDLAAWLDEQRVSGVELAVIDTAPRAGAWATAVLQCADLIVIPLRPTALDLLALDATALLVKSAKRPALVVLSQVPPRSPEADDMPTIIAARTKLEVATARIGERRAYARALAEGLAVSEFPGSMAARTEIVALAEELLAAARGGQRKGKRG